MDEDEDYTCDLTEEELFELTEGLLDNDENNCAKYFRYNFQGDLLRGIDIKAIKQKIGIFFNITWARVNQN